MIESTKGVEKRKKEVSAVGVTYLSLGVSICFILKFLLDFRKDNLVITISLSLPRTTLSLSRINVFETYEIWILGDPWINILYLISSLIWLSISPFPYEVGWPTGGLGILDGF